MIGSLSQWDHMTETSEAPNGVVLREVSEQDVQTFYENQLDSEAIRIAAFPARGRETHFSHWRKTLTDKTVCARTVLFEGDIAGYVVSWPENDERKVGYWIGRGFWGKGIATNALSQFLRIDPTRPILGYVIKDNLGSIRVLEKCGFTVDRAHPGARSDEVVLTLMN